MVQIKLNVMFLIKFLILFLWSVTIKTVYVTNQTGYLNPKHLNYLHDKIIQRLDDFYLRNHLKRPPLKSKYKITASKKHFLFATWWSGGGSIINNDFVFTFSSICYNKSRN